MLIVHYYLSLKYNMHDFCFEVWNPMNFPLKNYLKTKFWIFHNFELWNVEKFFFSVSIFSALRINRCKQNTVKCARIGTCSQIVNKLCMFFNAGSYLVSIIMYFNVLPSDSKIYSQCWKLYCSMYKNFPVRLIQGIPVAFPHTEWHKYIWFDIFPFFRRRYLTFYIFMALI